MSLGSAHSGRANDSRRSCRSGSICRLVLSEVAGAEPGERGALQYYDSLYDDDRWTAEVVLGLLELVNRVGPLTSGGLLVRFLGDATAALASHATT